MLTAESSRNFREASYEGEQFPCIGIHRPPLMWSVEGVDAYTERIKDCSRIEIYTMMSAGFDHKDFPMIFAGIQKAVDLGKKQFVLHLDERYFDFFTNAFYGFKDHNLSISFHRFGQSEDRDVVNKYTKVMGSTPELSQEGSSKLNFTLIGYKRGQDPHKLTGSIEFPDTAIFRTADYDLQSGEPLEGVVGLDIFFEKSSLGEISLQEEFVHRDIQIVPPVSMSPGLTEELFSASLKVSSEFSQELFSEFWTKNIKAAFDKFSSCGTPIPVFLSWQKAMPDSADNAEEAQQRARAASVSLAAELEAVYALNRLLKAYYPGDATIPQFIPIINSYEASDKLIGTQDNEGIIEQAVRKSNYKGVMVVPESKEFWGDQFFNQLALFDIAKDSSVSRMISPANTNYHLAVFVGFPGGLFLRGEPSGKPRGSQSYESFAYEGYLTDVTQGKYTFINPQEWYSGDLSPSPETLRTIQSIKEASITGGIINYLLQSIGDDIRVGGVKQYELWWNKLLGISEQRAMMTISAKVPFIIQEYT
jgi:hypothetical protein